MKICEICKSTYRVCIHRKSGLLVCNKHYNQLTCHGKIIKTGFDYTHEERICEICGSTCRVNFNNKTQQLLCENHRKHIRLYGKIIRTRFDSNEIIIYDDYAEICLYNKHCEEIARTKIDLDDIEKCKKHKWSLDKDNYIICKAPKRLAIHKYILNYTGKLQIDHKDLNRLNNRKENLRICTSQENNMNKGLRNNNTSGYTGVVWDIQHNKWRSNITYNYKNIHLGIFDNINDAIETRRLATIKYFGEFRYKGEK